MVGPGRPKNYSKWDKIEEVLLLHKENIVRDGKVVSRTDKIWTTLSEKIENLASACSLWTTVKKNYNGIQETLSIASSCPSTFSDSGAEENLKVETSDEKGFNCSELEDKLDPDYENFNLNPKIFFLTISYNEFKSLLPHAENYKKKINNKEASRKRNIRKYIVFQQRHWTRILYERFDPQLKRWSLPCRITFKRNKIHLNGIKYYAALKATCRECSANFLCIIDNLPKEEQDVIINVFSKDVTKITHKQDIARPISGTLRQQISQQLVETNIAPSQYRRLLAAENKLDSFVPKLSTLRQAKHELVKKQRLDDDPIVAIWKMKVDPNMGGAIQNIGLDPFFVYFWDNTQIHVYNKFCKTEYSKISIDATGGIVYKIRKPSNEKGAHIFLYDVTVRSTYAKYDSQYSVSSMLSESQNAVSIHSWLAHWIRAGATRPREVVTDMSLALIYACTLAFTNSKTLREYLSHCYRAVFENSPFPEQCYLRIDVAHFIKLATTWPSLNKQHKLTRQFYLRAVGQLIQCSNLQDLENLLIAIFTVSFSDTEGKNVFEEDTLCEVRKEWLKRRCSTGTIEAIEHYLNVEDQCSVNFNEKELLSTGEFEQNSYEQWATQIAMQCEDFLNKGDQIGNRGNQQCLPQFAKDLLKYCRTIPLWTAILSKFFPNSPQIGSSASVESNFNNIKHRVFGNKDLPIRVDEFLHTLIASNRGQAKLVQRRMDIQETQLTEKNNDAIPIVIENCDSADKIEVFCPSCQLHQKAYDVCINCKVEVHKHVLCSILTEDGKIFCRRCSKLEQASGENWRGLTNYKRPRSSYLEPNSELLEAEFSSLRNVLPVPVLRNGHLVDLQPIRISKDISLTLSNTCAFDSLIQVMACCYCDSFVFKDLVLRMVGHSSIADLIFYLINTGLTKKAYKMRAIILEKIFNKTPHLFGILKLNVETEMGNLIPRLDFNACVALETQCSNCGFANTEYKTTLEVAVEFAKDLPQRILTSTQSKRSEISCDKCQGVQVLNYRIGLTHLIIEPLDLVKRVFNLESALEDLPKKLTVCFELYVLRGVIGYVGPNVGVGHFKAYCLRHNNRWEVYDDTESKRTSCSSKRVVNGQILFYSSPY